MFPQTFLPFQTGYTTISHLPISYVLKHGMPHKHRDTDIKVAEKRIRPMLFTLWLSTVINSTQKYKFSLVYVNACA